MSSKYISPNMKIKIKERDEWRCIFPGCEADSLDVHHIIHLAKGGMSVPENLATLCPTHHR